MINFFILDTYSEDQHGDIDFINYIWKPDVNNKISVGDKFIYRTPGRANKGNFFLFGGGEIGEIINIDGSNNAKIIKPFNFTKKIYMTDLSNFNWTFKSKKSVKWNNFFNQYGITKINEEDYNNLVKLGNSDLNNFNDGIYYGLAKSSYNNFELLYDTLNEVVYWDNKSPKKWNIGDRIFFKNNNFFYSGFIEKVDCKYYKESNNYFVGDYKLRNHIDRTLDFEGKDFIKVKIVEKKEVDIEKMNSIGYENNKIIKGQSEFVYLSDKKNYNISKILELHFGQENFIDKFVESSLEYSFEELKLDLSNVKEYEKKEKKEKKVKNKIDYIEKNIKNTNVGLLGEEIVFNHEKEINGERVIWKSKIDDSLGYDILSYDGNTEKHIEVKTTNSSNNKIFLSINEIEASKKIKNYWIYFVNTKNKKISSIKITDVDGNNIVDLLKIAIPINFTIDMNYFN